MNQILKIHFVELQLGNLQFPHHIGHTTQYSVQGNVYIENIVAVESTHSLREHYNCMKDDNSVDKKAHY